MFTDELLFDITERFNGDRLITRCVQNVLQTGGVVWGTSKHNCLVSYLLR